MQPLWSELASTPFGKVQGLLLVIGVRGWRLYLDEYAGSDYEGSDRSAAEPASIGSPLSRIVSAVACGSVGSWRDPGRSGRRSTLARGRLR